MPRSILRVVAHRRHNATTHHNLPTYQPTDEPTSFSTPHFQPFVAPQGSHVRFGESSRLFVVRGVGGSDGKTGHIGGVSVVQPDETSASVASASSSSATASAASATASSFAGNGGDTTKLSKAMSHVLRHGLVENGLDYRPDGYVRVDDLKKASKGGLKHASLEELRTVVRACTKQRFSLIQEGATWWIRANQGHTVLGIDPEQLLTPVADATDLPVVIHGTYHKNWAPIQENGLCRMARWVQVPTTRPLARKPPYPLQHGCPRPWVGITIGFLIPS